MTILHSESTQLSKIELKQKYKSFIKSTQVSKVLVLDMCNITEHILEMCNAVIHHCGYIVYF